LSDKLGEKYEAVFSLFQIQPGNGWPIQYKCSDKEQVAFIFIENKRLLILKIRNSYTYEDIKYPTYISGKL
jgi:hypothetical protein